MMQLTQVRHVTMTTVANVHSDYIHATHIIAIDCTFFVAAE